MNARVPVLGLAFCLMAAQTWAQQVSVNYDHGQDFSQFHTYAVDITDPNKIANSILAQSAMSDVDNALQGKGLSKVELSANPDLIVTVSGGLQQQTSYSAWGMRGIGGGMGGITPEQSVEGTLVVSIYSAPQKALVWRGIGQGTLSNNGNKNQQSVGKAVTKMFKRWPAESPSAPPPFQWPPPRASAEKVLPASILTGARTLGDIDKILSAAFEQTGYGERSYFSVPGGLALVARLEQIYPDGRSMPPPARFSAEPVTFTRLTILEYLQALFNADPGHYRVIVFIVSSKPFRQAEGPPSSSEATSWLGNGDNVLTSSFAEQAIVPDTRCTALIYEFANPSKVTASNSKGIASKAVLLKPNDADALDAKTHLVKSGLWIALHLN